jgi:hypothetical protein
MTISNLSPSVNCCEANKLRGTISPLRSKAMRLPVKPISSMSAATLVESGNWRVAPLMLTIITFKRSLGFSKIRCYSKVKIYLGYDE